LDDLEQTAERMKSSINNLMEQTIDKLIANANKKVTDWSCLFLQFHGCYTLLYSLKV